MRTLIWSPEEERPPISPEPPDEPATPPPARAVPLFAGAYRIDRQLGRTEIDVSYGAVHVASGTRVAIKVLAREATRDRDARIRFEREARASTRLSSEHVAKVYDVGLLADDRPYIVSECLEGQTLAEVLELRGVVPFDEAVDWAVQICEALAGAHAAGIIHRDLKPENVILVRGSDGEPLLKVVGFGTSKIAGASAWGRKNHTVLLTGSPGWTSPEQMRSSRDVDARSDIWALGAILYRMLTGASPFLVSSPGALFAIALSAKPEPPSRVNPSLPPTIDRVVLRALEQDRDARYDSVAALAGALAPYALSQTLDRIALVERMAPPALRPAPQLPPVAALPSVPPVALDEQAVPLKRGRWVWALIPIAVVLGAIAAVLVPTTRRVAPAARPAVTVSAAPPPPAISTEVRAVSSASAPQPSASTSVRRVPPVATPRGVSPLFWDRK